MKYDIEIAWILFYKLSKINETHIYLLLFALVVVYFLCEKF